jgi:peptidoglycan/LPS O-acetylase OafA/YrhL
MSPTKQVATAPTPARSVAIDLLRGVAVFMVMLAHVPFSRAGFGSGAGQDVFPPAAISSVLAHGHYGVQLFLVISGYCIHTRWARTADLGARVDFMAFWRRRLTRLYPPYLLMIIVSVGITLAAARFFPGSVPPISPRQLIVDLIVLLLLLQNLTGASARIGNPPFWSLALEEQLYLLYFPLLAVRRAWGWSAACALAAAVTVTWTIAGGFVPASIRTAWYLTGPAYWIAWTLGAVAAEAHLGVLKLPRWCSSFLLFVVVAGAAAFLSGPLQALLVTLSFFFLVQATIELERKTKLEAAWSVPLVRLGRFSYSVYLVHDVVFVVAKRVLVVLGSPPLVTLVLRGAAGVAAGYVLFRLVEEPVLRVAQRIPVPLIHDRVRRASTSESIGS